MIIVNLTGGLGNQMFQYAFVKELQSRGIKAYSNFYQLGKDRDIEKAFNIEPSKKEKNITSFFSKNIIFRLLRKFFIIHIIEPQSLYSTYDSKYLSDKHILPLHYVGTWQSERYFEGIKNSIDSIFKFANKLSNNTCNWRDKISSSPNSVAIHIRRGDYLKPEYITLFGGICTLDYYYDAINYIEKKVSNPSYFIFTNDAAWVESNLKIDNSFLVEGNDGEDSWQDMYLMSLCKHAVIANSTFSWWGAYLNKNKRKIVIAPRKWFNTIEAPDIVPSNWIRL